MSQLSWLDDESLEQAVQKMLQRAEKATVKAAEKIKENVIDPFSSLMLAATFDVDAETLLRMQQVISASQGVSSAVGGFHQEVLGKVGGFVNHDSGYDLECVDRKIIAEIKNKHNTMNATNRLKTEQDLNTALQQKAGNWTAYLVLIIPKQLQRHKKKLGKREFYEIDGASFYTLATGSETALHDLYYAVAQIATELKPHIKQGEILNYCKDALIEGIPK